MTSGDKPLTDKENKDGKNEKETTQADDKEEKGESDSAKNSAEEVNTKDNLEDVDEGEEEEEEEEENPLYAQLASKYALNVEEKLQEIEKEEKEIERKEFIATSDQAVDLSKLHLRYNAKQKPALKSVLVEYGLPDEEKPVKRMETVRVRKSRDYSDSEAESEAHHLHQERNEKYRLSDYLREEDYMETLENKIAKQRKQIEKRSEELERRLKHREEKQQAATHSTKKMVRHDLTHDANYLKTVPKSNTYKVIVYESKLKSAGKLNKRTQIDDFWEHSKDVDALKKYVRLQGIDAASSKASSHPHMDNLEESFISSRTSSLSSIDQEKEKTAVDFRPLTQINESREPSRPSTRDANASQPWAVTQQFPSHHGPQKKSQDPYIIAKQAAIELDKQHPMMQLPPMSCFMDLGENQIDPAEVLKQLRSERKDKERKLFVKRIRKMYHLAQANTAVTQRIMAKRDDFEIDQEASPSDTWLSSYIELDDSQKIPLTEEEKFHQARPWLRYVRHRAIVPIVEESEPPSGFSSKKNSASRDGARRARSDLSRNVSSQLSNIQSEYKTKPLALALPQLENSSNVVEAKCLSSLWTNYLEVGKSVFAK